MYEFNYHWFYRGKIYDTRKELKQENRLSTHKFNAKVRDNEIIKLSSVPSANEIRETTLQGLHYSE